MPDGASSRLVADANISTMSHHTARTQAMHYSTTINNWREMAYTKYHVILGEGRDTSNSTDNEAFHWLPFSTEQLASALRSLIGSPSAQFRNPNQQRLVEVCANGTTKHRYGFLRCGTGKSLSFLVPAVAELHTGRRMRTRIIILPYSFLLGHMVEHSRRQLGVANQYISVFGFSGSDITDAEIPDEIAADSLSLPNLIFLNLRAASNLIRFHFGRLERWSSSGQLVGIYIDEIQALKGDDEGDTF